MAPSRATFPARTGLATGLARLAAAGLGLAMAALGVWSFTDPAGFAAWVAFPVHIHFLHDLGAFQIGIGATLLLAIFWRDALLVALGGFFVGNTLHVISHLRDAARGGRPHDWAWLGLASLVALLVIVVYRRAQSSAAAAAAPATSPATEPPTAHRTVAGNANRGDA